MGIVGEVRDLHVPICLYLYGLFKSLYGLSWYILMVTL